MLIFVLVTNPKVFTFNSDITSWLLHGHISKLYTSKEELVWNNLNKLNCFTAMILVSWLFNLYWYYLNYFISRQSQLFLSPPHCHLPHWLSLELLTNTVLFLASLLPQDLSNLLPLVILKSLFLSPPPLLVLLVHTQFHLTSKRKHISFLLFKSHHSLQMVSKTRVLTLLHNIRCTRSGYWLMPNGRPSLSTEAPNKLVAEEKTKKEMIDNDSKPLNNGIQMRRLKCSSWTLTTVVIHRVISSLQKHAINYESPPF